MSLKLEHGTVIAGRYQLERLLGQGGMATVWEAKHLMTRRSVAMKFLHAALDARPEMRRRFLREAQAAAAVDHPHVVTVHDVFQLDDGTLVLVMARLEGETLAARLAREAPLSVEETVAVMCPVVSAVGSAHSRGVIHRDLKPDNVFLSLENGTTVVRVLDFGIAKLTEQEDSGVLTTTGTVLGTPCYMAPEQAYAEKNIDHRVDVWSLGAMLYEALTGSRPIEGDSLGQVVKHMLTQGITPIFVLAPTLASDLALLITRMLRIEPEGRPSDLREVHAVLARYARTTTPSFGPPVSSDHFPPTTAARPTPPRSLQPDKAELRRVVGRRPQDDLPTLPQTRALEARWNVGSGSSNTTGAHAMPLVHRGGHRWVLFVVTCLALTLSLVLFAMLKTRSRDDANKSMPSGVTTTLAAAKPTLPAAALPATMPADPASSAPVVTSAPAAPTTKQAPKPSARAPRKPAPAASSDAPAPPQPTPLLAPSAQNATTGLHEAVPF